MSTTSVPNVPAAPVAQEMPQTSRLGLAAGLGAALLVGAATLLWAREGVGMFLNALAAGFTICS